MNRHQQDQPVRKVSKVQRILLVDDHPLILLSTEAAAADLHDTIAALIVAQTVPEQLMPFTRAFRAARMAMNWTRQ